MIQDFLLLLVEVFSQELEEKNWQTNKQYNQDRPCNLPLKGYLNQSESKLTSNISHLANNTEANRSLFGRALQGGLLKLLCKKRQRREKWGTQTWKRLTVVSVAISMMTLQWSSCFSTPTSWAGQAWWNPPTYPSEGVESTCALTRWLLILRTVPLEDAAYNFSTRCNFSHMWIGYRAASFSRGGGGPSIL